MFIIKTAVMVSWVYSYIRDLTNVCNLLYVNYMSVNGKNPKQRQSMKKTKAELETWVHSQHFYY